MLIEQALKTYLEAQSGLIALVPADRIYFVHAPQDTQTPYIVFFKVSGPRLHSHDGSSELANPRFQFSVFATTYYSCKQIAAQLQAALQGYSGTMGGGSGVAVGSCFYENETDDYETDTKLYHVAVDYILWHEE